MNNRFKLVTRDDEQHTLHVEHPHEEFNVDDAKAAAFVDDLTAAAMLDSGEARACGHCMPEGIVQ